MKANRNWQTRVLAKIKRNKKTDFFVEATPGSGKTRMAVDYARSQLSNKKVERVIVVSPTDMIRSQWVKGLTDADIPATAVLVNSGRWSRDATAVCCTYQQVILNPDRFNRWCNDKKTLVILDEVHHCAEDSEWGKKALLAFGDAVDRLSLSGTPFRSDSSQIPFLTYSEEGIAEPDFIYGYVDGLRDGIVRPVVFNVWGGEAEWIDPKNKPKSHLMSDEVPITDQCHRLRTALVYGDWLESVIKDADKRLSQIRQKKPNAGGLVVAIDKKHALDIAGKLEKITGFQPLIVTEDVPRSSEKIEEFSKGDDRWIVAVKMVSEGVDVPRLRVGVYATVIKRELTFRQVVGRFVRVEDGELLDPSFVYVPEDPQIVSMVESIESAIRHNLSEEEARKHIESLREMDDIDRKDKYLPTFIPLGSTGEERSVVVSGIHLSRENCDRVNDKIKNELDGYGDFHSIARMMIANGEITPGPIEQERAEKRRSHDEEVSKYKKEATKIIRRLQGSTGRRASVINSHINDRLGIKSVSDASIEQLKERVRLASAYEVRMPEISPLSIKRGKGSKQNKKDAARKPVKA